MIQMNSYFFNNFPESLSMSNHAFSFICNFDAGTFVNIGPSTTALIAFAFNSVGTIAMVKGHDKQAAIVKV